MLLLHRADARTGDALRELIGRVPHVEAVTRHTTDLGSMFMVVAATATLERMGRRRTALEVLAAGSLGWVAAHKAKEVVERPRPYQAEGVRRLIPEPTGSSMPSGHSAVVAAVTTILAGESTARRRWPWPLVTLWVPMTRIHLGVHYPSDTLAGLTLGHALGRVVLAVSGLRPRASAP
jgi:undecaprenyl-diphosphatase